MDFRELAQELVEATSNLVRRRTINVMDTDGIIIASTEKERIGTFHAGAKRVVDTGKPLAIEKKQVVLYPGAKEGYNMPIRSNNTIIGVVGVYGDPEDIMDLAHLLEVYVTKYFELEGLMQQRLIESDLKSKLLHFLLMFPEHNRAGIKTLAETLQIRFRFPLRVLVVSFSDKNGEDRHFLVAEELAQKLLTAQLICAGTDVWGISDDHLVIIRSYTQTESMEFWETFLNVLNEGTDMCRLSIGSICHTLEEIRGSYQEAVLLNGLHDVPLHDMMNRNTRCDFLLAQTVRQNHSFVESLYEKLKQTFTEDEMDSLFVTIACYYDQGHSVSRAAAALFIHKNTLQYRIRRILDALDLTGCSGFYQEYLMRLLILYHQSKTGSQT